MTPLATFHVDDDDPQCAIVSVIGEVDGSNAAELGSVIRPYLLAGTLVIDCARLDFIDSSGLNVLMAAATQEDASRIELANCSPRLRRLLEITGTATLFTVEGPCPRDGRQRATGRLPGLAYEA